MRNGQNRESWREEMNELLTSAQMRAIEGAAIESGAVTGLELMERAGAGVVAAIQARFPALARTPGRAAIYCGPGNNGGDGYVIARLLHGMGWTVAVWSLGDPARLPPDARINFERWSAIGGVDRLEAERSILNAGFWQTPPDLFVDALFGTGLSRPLEGVAEEAIAEVQFYKERRMVGVRCVAVDIPSGLCADSGRLMGNRCLYDLTVTFHTAKPGHYLADGPDYCGAVDVVDIGLPRRGRFARPPSDVATLVEAPIHLEKRSGHKFDHGHALVVSGTMGRSGAARLAARAALRVGAGLVTVAAPGSAMMECAAQLTAVMLRRCDDAEGLAGLLGDARINALCMGPGLGMSDERAALMETALKSGRSLVLDADALTLIARSPALFAMLHDRCVLTPHGGEFSRLFPDLAKRLGHEPMSGPAYSRLDAVREAADRAGCVVLLKGPDTVIGAPGGFAGVHAAVYDRAVPWLATAGAGDVLAGLIAGLVARGHTGFDAARAAVWLHVEAARDVGPGLIAEDLTEALPAVLKRLAV